ncbi:hypothetical protein DPMN_094579 [Dreissena polymorpha]|uniref:Uncharacterized protein n=1 Tax=Dreissena polymorpha TaxID=45954 RepID=A0A9D4L4Z8_DREPO|nr:hypothetical protein DPMN_094579 [Dreissena polymorpha]
MLDDIILNVKLKEEKNFTLKTAFGKKILNGSVVLILPSVNRTWEGLKVNVRLYNATSNTLQLDVTEFENECGVIQVHPVALLLYTTKAKTNKSVNITCEALYARRTHKLEMFVNDERVTAAEKHTICKNNMHTCTSTLSIQFSNWTRSENTINCTFFVLGGHCGQFVHGSSTIKTFTDIASTLEIHPPLPVKTLSSCFQ